MPRKNPVLEREKAIGRRLRELREKHLAKRTALALRLGISSDRLASYEFGRVPLPWGIGSRICELFNVSQAWLLTGEAPARSMYLQPPEELKASASSRSLFSEVCQKFLTQKRRQWAASEAEVSTKVMLRVYDEARKLKNAGKFPPESFAAIEATLVETERAIKAALEQQMSDFYSRIASEVQRDLEEKRPARPRER